MTRIEEFRRMLESMTDAEIRELYLKLKETGLIDKTQNTDEKGEN